MNKLTFNFQIRVNHKLINNQQANKQSQYSLNQVKYSTISAVQLQMDNQLRQFNTIRNEQEQSQTHLPFRSFKDELKQLKKQMESVKRKHSNNFKAALIISLVAIVSICIAIQLTISKIQYQQSNTQQDFEIQKLKQQINLLTSNFHNVRNQYQKLMQKGFQTQWQTFIFTNEVCQLSSLLKQQQIKQKNITQIILKSLCQVINSQKILTYQISSLINDKVEINSSINNISLIIEQLDTVIQFLMKQQKLKVIETRIELINNSTQNQYTQQQLQFYKSLIKLNFDMPYKSQFQKMKGLMQRNKIALNQYNYYQNKYGFSEFTQELPFCVIIPSWNNAVNQRYQHNLNSILNQNYTNFKVHIVDDFSSDQTFLLIKRYLRKNSINSDKVTVQKNQKREYALSNIVETAKKYCKTTDIVVAIDGDDQLMGVNVFKLFNYFYHKNKLGVIWSNLLVFKQGDKAIYKGLSNQYTKQEIQNQSYRKREGNTIHMQLRAYKGDLLFSIKQEDLKQNGQYYKSASDQAIMFPMQQMSCHKLLFINETTYLYNLGTNNNDNKLNREQQVRLVNVIKSKSQYPCHKDYV